MDGDRPTVLMIDDNPVDREAVQRMLGAEYMLMSASSGAQGHELFLRKRPGCVLLDYRLPDGDGIGWLPRFVQEHAAVVMLTGVGDESVAAACVRGGAHDYLPKRELTRESLTRSVRTALERSQLLRQVELHRRLLHEIPIGVVVSRREDPSDPGSFRELWQNPAAERITGSRAYVGKTIGQSAPQLLQTPIPGMLMATLDTGQPQLVESVPYGDANVREGYYDFRTAKIGPDLVAILVDDVTAQAQAEAERSRMEEQMRAAQRLEAVGRLAGGVAHDFNNLLTVIQSYGYFLRDQLHEADPAHADAVAILEASERAAALTRQLLAFSRRQVQAPVVTNLNRIVQDVERMLRRLIGEDIDLVVKLDPELGNVRVDPSHMDQVLVNLAVNARDAMPDGGRLTIETKNVGLDTAYSLSKGSSVPPGEYVMLAVSDNGIGMSRETVDRIFEPFFTTKPRDKGTGLGLSTVYGIVKQAEGYIWVYSEPGRGTTFKVYLKRVDQPATARTQGAGVAPLQARGETLLLVEDEALVRRATRRMLEAAGYTVLEAAHGAEAIGVGETHRGPIHAVLTDIVMPEMSGRDVAEQLLERHPQVKVLYMSGYTENAVVHNRVLDEGVAFLQKPFTPDNLLRKVREVLDGG